MDHHISRRTFLGSLATVTALTPLTGIIPAATHSKSLKETKRKICLFSKHLQWLDYDAMAETAAEIGFDGIDLTVRPNGHVLPEKVDEDLPRAVDAVKRAGIEVPMMTTSITDPHDPLTEAILKKANQLGIGYYRMGYLNYDDALGVAKTLQKYKQQMAALAALNQKYSIHGAYQNHAGNRVGAPVWDLWELLKDLDPQWIGCQYDIRHATLEGGYSWHIGLKLLANHIQTTVIKDFKWGLVDGKWRAINAPLGEGMVDFKQYFALVKQLAIAGPISMHFEYPISDEAKQNISSEKRRKQTIDVMRKDLFKLKDMMAEANIS